MSVKKARKKPVEIEFMQFTDVESAEGIVEWVGDYNSLLVISDRPNPHITIIIKGVHGEFYPVKPDIFEKTYEVLKK